MGKIKRVFFIYPAYFAYLVFFLFSTGYALDYSPWFPIPFEFQGSLSYLYEHAEKANTPQGDFSAPTNNSSLQLDLDVTPFPNWNVETALLLTHTSDIAFAYEAALLNVRYAWFDDVAGDSITLVTGAALSFPGERFLHELSFDYHGRVNAEFHVTLGKEWAFGSEWLWRIWGLGGCGIATRGSPWIHGLGVIEAQFCPLITTGIFAESVYGLGKHNLVSNVPFEGYAAIGHQSVDIGAFFNYTFKYLGTLTASAWYNVHARNFIAGYWGASLSILIPFSLL